MNQSAILMPLLGVSFATIAGCASYGGYGLVAGAATADQVRRTMGEPVKICPLSGGASNWIYPRGPEGVETFNVKVDAAGVMQGIENVLQESGFSRLIVGKSSREDVLCLFGPPIFQNYYAARRETVWDYRFRDAWGYVAKFHILFDDAGIVTKTMQIREDRGSRNG